MTGQTLCPFLAQSHVYYPVLILVKLGWLKVHFGCALLSELPNCTIKKKRHFFLLKKKTIIYYLILYSLVQLSGPTSK